MATKYKAVLPDGGVQYMWSEREGVEQMIEIWNSDPFHLSRFGPLRFEEEEYESDDEKRKRIVDGLDAVMFALRQEGSTELACLVRDAIEYIENGY